MLGILQAANTDLLPDEALYWQFSERLAWGYFDQPPMVALLVKIGYYFFQNELGVRLLFVLLSTATIWVMEKLIRPTNFLLYATFISALAVFRLISFFATPDSVLLFFAALYFFTLNKFFKQKNRRHAVLIGLLAGLMLLTKYHSILIIIFSIIANPRLLKTKYFLIATLVAIGLFSPHIYWQIAHDFPTVTYHLFHRGDNSFTFYHLINYLLTAFIFFAPHLGFILYRAVVRSQPSKELDKTMWYVFWGVLIFYLLLTLRGNVEGNWLYIILIPFSYMGYSLLSQNQKLQRIHYRLFVPATLFILLVRATLAVNFLPNNFITKGIIQKFHNDKKSALAIHEVADDLPVVFINSFQSAAMYHFYTGQRSSSKRDFAGRLTQHDIWKDYIFLRGKKVLVVYNYIDKNLPVIMHNSDTISYTIVNNYQPSEMIKVAMLTPFKTIRAGAEITIPVELTYDLKKIGSAIHFDNSALTYFVINEKKQKIFAEKNIPLSIGDFRSGQIEVPFTAPKKKGTYQLFFALTTDWLPFTRNSKEYKIIVE